MLGGLTRQSVQQGIAAAIYGALPQGHLFRTAAAPLEGSLPIAVVAQPCAVLPPERAIIDAELIGLLLVLGDLVATV